MRKKAYNVELYDSIVVLGDSFQRHRPVWTICAHQQIHPSNASIRGVHSPLRQWCISPCFRFSLCLKFFDFHPPKFLTTFFSRWLKFSNSPRCFLCFRTFSSLFRKNYFPLLFHISPDFVQFTCFFTYFKCFSFTLVLFRGINLYNFGGTDIEKIGKNASAEGAKLLLPKARRPSRLGGLRERRKLPQRDLGRSPWSQRDFKHFMPKWSTFLDMLISYFLAIKSKKL